MSRKSTIEMFKELAESGLYDLRGDCMIVEELPQVEVKTSSGIVLNPTSRTLEGYSADKPIFVRVIQVGAGYEGEDGETKQLDFKVGDIILVGPLSTVRWFSDLFGMVANTSERRIGVMQGFAENAFITFESEEAYNQAHTVASKYK